jgi:hypothetical protein
MILQTWENTNGKMIESTVTGKLEAAAADELVMIRQPCILQEQVPSQTLLGTLDFTNDPYHR